MLEFSDITLNSKKSFEETNEPKEHIAVWTVWNVNNWKTTLAISKIVNEKFSDWVAFSYSKPEMNYPLNFDIKELKKEIYQISDNISISAAKILSPIEISTREEISKEMKKLSVVIKNDNFKKLPRWRKTRRRATYPWKKTIKKSWIEITWIEKITWWNKNRKWKFSSQIFWPWQRELQKNNRKITNHYQWETWDWIGTNDFPEIF